MIDTFVSCMHTLALVQRAVAALRGQLHADVRVSQVLTSQRAPVYPFLSRLRV
uniref:Uncharacterized protein n=1 Tax=Arundo donax TaxID=35708 RepID=A0A0A9AHB3_ARUDO